MDDKINVLITLPFPDVLIEKLGGISPQLVCTQREEPDPEDIADVDVLYTFSALPHPDDAPRLKWVQFHSAGIDHIIDHPLYTDSEIELTTTSGIHAIPVAEYVLAQMLAFAHHLPKMFEDKLHTRWPRDRWARYKPDELHGATVGIVGYGSIGRQVARLTQALGMKVLALKRDVRNLNDAVYTMSGVGDPEAAIPERIYPPQALHSFLGECDYVVLSAPLTKTTRGMISAEALATMKPSAILINVARGGLVDQAALVKALKEGTLAGAALDVYEEEPLPADSPLWDLPNVILSPHVSGYTPHYDDRAVEIFVENLRRFLAGEPLINLVDRMRGY